MVLGGLLTFRQKAFFGRAVQWLALFAHSLAFARVFFALLHKARFGRPVKRLAIFAHRPAVAGLRHGRADGERSN